VSTIVKPINFLGPSQILKQQWTNSLWIWSRNFCSKIQRVLCLFLCGTRQVLEHAKWWR